MHYLPKIFLSNYIDSMYNLRIQNIIFCFYYINNKNNYCIKKIIIPYLRYMERFKADYVT